MRAVEDARPYRFYPRFYCKNVNNIHISQRIAPYANATRPAPDEVGRVGCIFRKNQSRYSGKRSQNIKRLAVTFSCSVRGRKVPSS